MSTKSSKESFVNALELLEKEKGIPKEYLLEKIETALVSAYHKEYGANANVRIELNLEKDDIRVYQQMTVVETVTDPETEISEEDAKAINKRYRVGQEIEIRVEPKNFRRLSAKAATSVIVQSIREGERMVRQEAYENQCNEIITATVLKIDPETGDVILDTGNGRAKLPKSEQIPGEEFYVDDKVKVYVMRVNKEAQGPLVSLSRCHVGLVRRLLELEIPEQLKLFQLSEEHRRLVVIEVTGLRRKNGSLLPEYTEEEFNEATFAFVKYYVQGTHYDTLVEENKKLKFELEQELEGRNRVDN